MNLNLSRIIYLANEFKPDLPNKELLKYVPQVEIVVSVIKSGIEGTAAEHDIALDQLENLYQEGASSGKGTPEEFQLLLAKIMLTEVELRRDQLTLSKYLSLIKDISDYSSTDSVSIINTEEADLGEYSENGEGAESIPKHNSGLVPLDLLTGGLYQGITTIIARPGHGKTSMMVTIAEAYRTTNAASSIWIIETEIPKPLMLYRLSPSTARVKYIKGKDKLYCGVMSIQKIEEMVREDPDPDRVILIDSPDVMAAGSGEQKRFKIEEIYLGLIRLKPLTKTLIVTSWPRRNDRHITLESGAEAWAKAWYSDIVLGMAKLARSGQGFNNVRLNCVKNRFGVSDNDVTFQYNYGDLSWEMDTANLGENDDW